MVCRVQQQVGYQGKVQVWSNNDCMDVGVEYGGYETIIIKKQGF